MRRTSILSAAVFAAALTPAPTALAAGGPPRAVDLIVGNPGENFELLFALAPVDGADCEARFSTIARSADGQEWSIVREFDLLAGDVAEEVIPLAQFQTAGGAVFVLETTMLHQTGPCRLLANGRWTDQDRRQTFAAYRPQFYFRTIDVTGEEGVPTIQLPKTLITSYQVGAGEELVLGFKLDPIVVVDGERRRMPSDACRARFDVETEDATGVRDPSIDGIALSSGNLYGTTAASNPASTSDVLLVYSKVKMLEWTGPCGLLFGGVVRSSATGQTGDVISWTYQVSNFDSGTP